MEERSIKHLPVRLVRPLHLHAVQLLRPRRARAPRRLLQPDPVRDLAIEVPPRLVDGDERHPEAHVHHAHPALDIIPEARVRREERTGARGVPGSDAAVLRDAPAVEGGVEARAEVACEAAGVRGGGGGLDDPVLALGGGSGYFAPEGVDGDGAVGEGGVRWGGGDDGAAGGLECDVGG